MESMYNQRLVCWDVHLKTGSKKFLRDKSILTQQRLYHMLPWPYAKNMIENHSMLLMPVRKWGLMDPYEEWWCKQLFEQEGSKLKDVQAYGLCWTIGEQDEPRWRMAAFRRYEPIVRIESCVESILDAGCKMIHQSNGSLFLGYIQYKHKDKLKELAASVKGGERKQVSRMAAEMLLQKRAQYQFEEEVRLLWIPRGQMQDFVYIPMDLKKFIASVMVSPYENSEVKCGIHGYLKERGIKVEVSDITENPEAR